MTPYPPSSDDRVVTRRSVVIVAFDGMQPLDAVGPHEVFAGATAVLALEEAADARLRPDHRLEARHADHHGERAADRHGSTTGLPAAGRTKIDTLLIPGGDGTDAARYDKPLVDWIRTAARSSRRIATVCSGAFIAAEAGPARRAHGDDALGQGTPTGRRVPTSQRRRRPDLSTRRHGVDVRRSDSGHRPVARDRRSRLRHRCRPDRRSLDGDVPAPARWPDAVRHAGVGSPRPPDRACARRRTTSTTIRPPTIGSIYWPSVPR